MTEIQTQKGNKSEAVRQLDSKLEGSSESDVVSFGTAGAGKSTFLTAIHRILGYSVVGIPIDRGRARNKGNVHQNRNAGILRGNATVEEVDKLQLYAQKGNSLVNVNWIAPGSHYAAKQHSGGKVLPVLFMDLSFLQCAKELLEEKEIEFFPLREHRGDIFRYTEERFGYGRAKKLGDTLRNVKGFFKSDEVGTTLESLLAAQEILDGLNGVVGIQTTSRTDFDGLSTEPSENYASAEKVFNELLVRYTLYLGEKGLPQHFGGDYKEMTILAKCFGATEKLKELEGIREFEHNNKVKRFDFSRVGKSFLVDSMVDSNEVVSAAQYIISRAADSDVRLVRFIFPRKEDTKTVFYKNV